jgi:hypothetical protein
MSEGTSFSSLAPVVLVALSALFGAKKKTAEPLPLAVHPDNPHYFLFREKPTVLIGSGEHYGAVLNLDFDYVKYLDELQSNGLNHTRTFTGPYVEPEGAFRITGNTLAPASGRFVCPWARSDESGYGNGGNKFDLAKWDDAYFNRLKDFVGQAGTRGVVVEVVLFCPFYEELQWELSPFKATNNISGFPDVARTDVYTLKKSGPLLKIQEEMVRKVVTELHSFDNVYFEICNEPYFGGVQKDWQEHMATLIAETEEELGSRHLVSMNIANGSETLRTVHPEVSILNFHYASPPDAVYRNYRLEKVIGDNETGFRGTDDQVYRIEAWNFIISGGGLFSHLDYSFAVGHEDGTYEYPPTQPGGGNRAFRAQMKVLKDFIEGLDFIEMKPDASFIKKGVPVGFTARALRKGDETFAIYLSETPVPKDAFSVRWDGGLKPEFSEPYTFYIHSNDGVRLFIDNKKVIDNWTEHTLIEDQTTVDLTADHRHAIRLEYYQNGGSAALKLEWSSPSQAREVVPEARFHLPVGVKHGLRGKYYLGAKFDRLWKSRDDLVIDFDWSVRSPFAGVFGGGEEDPLAELILTLDQENYHAEWISPALGTVLRSEKVKFVPGETVFVSPTFQGDIALLIRKE